MANTPNTMSIKINVFDTRMVWNMVKVTSGWAMSAPGCFITWHLLTKQEPSTNSKKLSMQTAITQTPSTSFQLYWMRAALAERGLRVAHLNEALNNPHANTKERTEVL